MSLSIVFILNLAAASARADAASETRLRDALRSVTGQLRALEDEQARWQAKDAAAKKELEALRQELAAARKAAGRKVPDAAAKKACESKIEAFSQQLAEQSKSSAALTESLAQCQKAGREAGEAARAKEEERAKLTGQIDGLASRNAACAAKNARLFQTAKEITDWLGNLGSGAALCEPFFGFKRIEVENKAQDYQDKLLEQKL